MKDMENGYNIFLMIELARAKGHIDEELEYDLTWDKGKDLFREFEDSDYNNPERDLYFCIDDFLDETQGIKIG